LLRQRSSKFLERAVADCGRGVAAAAAPAVVDARMTTQWWSQGGPSSSSSTSVQLMHVMTGNSAASTKHEKSKSQNGICILFLPQQVL
jgi:hypothetical protein